MVEHATQTAKTAGIAFRGIYSSEAKGSLTLVHETGDFSKYLEWLKLFPPPTGARATHEVLFELSETGIAI